jgi:hypothetical protein
MPRDAETVSRTLRTGVDVTIGYEVTARLFQMASIRRVGLLSIGDRQYFGPEDLRAYVRRWRSSALVTAAIGLTTALYNVVMLFRSLVRQEPVG